MLNEVLSVSELIAIRKKARGLLKCSTHVCNMYRRMDFGTGDVLMFIIPGVLYIGYFSRARTMQLQSSKLRRPMNDGSAVKCCIACYGQATCTGRHRTMP